MAQNITCVCVHQNYLIKKTWYFVGAFVPLTAEGNIIVDGVLASCYASIDHDLGHIGLTPFRWFPRMLNWIFGADDETSVFVNLLERFGELSRPDTNV